MTPMKSLKENSELFPIRAKGADSQYIPPGYVGLKM